MRIRKSRVAAIATLMLVCGFSFEASAQKSPANLEGLRPDSATVVVKQGDVEITLADVDTWMLEVPEKDRSGFIRSPERIENMLFQLLIMKQLNMDARANKLDQQAHVASHMRFASERTLARYQTEAARQAIKVPNLAELSKEKYLANPEIYREPDIATVVHLLITTEKRGADAAEKLIQKLHKQALKDPAKLEAMVVKYADDPSASLTQGKIKDVSLATLDPAFADAARKLEPGQLSAPVKTEFGWHIIRLDAITRGRLPPFEELKGTIQAAVENEYRDQTFRGYMNGLRQRAMEPNPEVLEKLPYRYGGEPDTMTAPAPAADGRKKVSASPDAAGYFSVVE